MVRQPLAGEIWVRKVDSLPLRITMRAERVERGVTMADVAAVEYSRTPHGFLTPASAVHRRFDACRLTVENRFRYGAFRIFKADADIKFTEVPEPPQ